MQYAKAIAAVVGALAAVLLSFNIEVSEVVQGAIITLGTALVVALAPRNEDPV